MSELLEPLIRAMSMEMFDNQSDFAKQVGVTPTTVSEWKHRIRPVPPARALQIERLTDGAIPAGHLNPKAEEYRVFLGMESPAAA